MRRSRAGVAFATNELSERVHRQRAKYKARDQSKRAVEHRCMKSDAGLAGQRARVKMEPRFRRQFARGRSPIGHWVIGELFAGRNKTASKIAMRFSKRCKIGTKILLNELARKSYSFEFLSSGTRVCGIQDTSSIDVLLVPALFLEFAHKADSLISGASAVLSNDVHQRALDILGHPLGVTTDIDMRAFCKPGP